MLRRVAALFQHHLLGLHVLFIQNYRRREIGGHVLNPALGYGDDGINQHILLVFDAQFLLYRII